MRGSNWLLYETVSYHANEQAVWVLHVQFGMILPSIVSPASVFVNSFFHVERVSSSPPRLGREGGMIA
jgi:hypothetical protein